MKKKTDEPLDYSRLNTNKVIAAFSIIRRGFHHIENVLDENSLNKCKNFYCQNGTKIVQSNFKKFFNKKRKNVIKVHK